MFTVGRANLVPLEGPARVYIRLCVRVRERVYMSIFSVPFDDAEAKCGALDGRDGIIGTDVPEHRGAINFIAECEINDALCNL